jgi:3-oxoadipate enol-lactonase / 4-carboxymuconolactone decarboxylase
MSVLHHRIDGPDGAPVLVLLNSLGSSLEMWTPCVGPLSERFRVVRMDARGHGDSAPVRSPEPIGLADLGRDVLDTADALGLDRFHLAGVSVGGMTGMWLAIHHPERIARLALICTSAHLPPASGWTDRAAAVRAAGVGSIADVTARRWITPGLAERDPALLDRLREMLAATDAEDYAALCGAIAAMDLRPDLGRIAAPTLVVSADGDPATPPEHGRVIADGIPGARFELITGAAHISPVEAPAVVVALLRDHLRGGATAASGFATRRAVLGDAHVDAAIAATVPVTAAFQDFITRYAWGDVWTREELSRRERSIVTLTSLISLGNENEIAMHVRAALRNGLTPEEIAEVCLHTAVYAGVPRSNSAFAIIRRTLAESA